MTGNTSFSIPIQSACKNVLSGLYWFSESLRYVCVCISDGRGIKTDLCVQLSAQSGEPGTELTKVSQFSTYIIIYAVHYSYV